MERYPVWAEVDLDAIGHNCDEARKVVGDHRGILMVVKADGYGLGAIAVCNEAARHGVGRFGVATLDEGVELREAGIDLPIVMFTPPLLEEAERVVRYEIEPSIFSYEFAGEYSRVCTGAGVIGRYQVEVDTGMGRWGVFARDAVPFLKRLRDLKAIELAGIYTHFPATRSESVSFSREQIRLFDDLLAALRAEGIEPPVAHAANSACLCWGIEESFYQAVRPGIFLYGFVPETRIPPGVTLCPALSFRSRVVQVRKCEGGENISYGLTYSVPAPTTIATIPVGYGHGYDHHLSNGGEVLIHGKRAPIVGEVTMDALMVDCGKIPGVEPGDEVVLIGSQGDEEIPVSELACRTGRIPYEITLAIGRRVPRVYTRSRHPLWARTMLGSRNFGE